MSDIQPESVCFKPLAPDQPYCATQSSFQWWQNDLDLFLTEYKRSDYEACEKNDEHEFFGWQDHFIACTNNPSSVNDGASDGECLGEYGGPAFPFVALGGYPKDKDTKITTYTNSTALIMSLELDNFEDRFTPEFEKALSWEQDFIQNFVKKQTN